MSESFLKIKKQKKLDALFVSFLIGVSVGMLASGALMLGLHLSESGLVWYVPLSVGVGAALLAGIVAYAFLHKSDKALAAELDRRFSLREKTATMLEFKDSDGVMHRLQRENASATLAGLSWQRPFFKRFGAVLISCVLATALFVTSIAAVYAGREETPPTVPEEPYSITEWQLGALGALIENVRFSDFDRELKAATVSELERLLSALTSADTLKGMKNEVISTIVTVDLLTENTATYKLIASALGGAEDGNVRLLAASLLTLNDVGFSDNVSPIRADLANETLYRDHITAFHGGVGETLSGSGVDGSDPLYAAIDAFSSKLYSLLSEEGLSFGAYSGKVDKIFGQASNSIGIALAAHYANRAVRTHVIDQLLAIFSVSASELPPLVGDVFPRIELDPDDRRPDDAGKESSGGYGSGAEKFGSDDEIYDPFGENGAGYVSYSAVFDDYQAIIRDLIASGELDAETESMLTQYFIRLSDGSKKRIIQNNNKGFLNIWKTR